MARKNKAAVASTATVAVDNIWDALTVRIVDNVTQVAPSDLQTYAEAFPKLKKGNVGRDVEQSEDAILARAVSMRLAQMTPIIVTTLDNTVVVVDGDGRLKSARCIVAGFDYNGTTYDPAPDYMLDVRPIGRIDGEPMPLADIETFARYANNNRNDAGVKGAISIARTAQKFRATGVKGGKLLAMFRECGLDLDQGQLSKYEAALKLPKTMQEKVMAADIGGEGIAYTSIQSLITSTYKDKNGDDVTRVFPTDKQFAAYVTKATYTEKGQLEGHEVTITRTDFRGDCIREWFAAGYDLTCPTFANWVPDGKVKPVAPATPAETEITEVRNNFKWSVVGKAVGAEATNASTAVGQTMCDVYAVLDSVVYVPPTGSDKRKEAALTAQQAGVKLRELLAALESGEVVIRPTQLTPQVVAGVGDAGKSADDDA